MSIVATAAVVVATSTLAIAEPVQVGRDGATIQEAIDRAPAGSTIEIGEGVWHEHLRIEKTVHLVGKKAVIDGDGRGKTIVIAAPGVVIEGTTVRGSGGGLTGQPDSCIWVEAEAVGSKIINNELRDCGFGIWINTTRKVVIEGNRVYGRVEDRVTDRGNGIHLFDAGELSVKGNFVTGARDGIYVSATEDSVISDNVLENQRYGIHYMFSYDNTLEGNQSRKSLGGLALMESRNLTVSGNTAEDNERTGILFRDVQYSTIDDNVLERNGQGLFFFNSTENKIRRNRIADNDIGVKIWAGSLRNEISKNLFIANRQQVFYVGSSDLIIGTEGSGNYWSDYVGWDQNGDGLGDRQHRLDSFTTTLVYRYPAAGMLMHSPGVELLAHLQEKMPLLQTPTVVDVSPQISARIR